MITRDEPMALVVIKIEGTVAKTIIGLGYATLDGNEMHRIQKLAESKGCYAYTTTIEEDFPSFDSLYKEVEKALR